MVYIPKPNINILSMSDLERKRCSILVVDSDLGVRNNMRQMFVRMGFGGVSDATDHALALQKVMARQFTHVVFEAKKTNMPARDFLQGLLDYDENIVALPSSYEPTVDDVFGLLILGARGYVVKPFTEESLEDAIVQATKGDPVSDSILFAKDRNEALASLVMTALDKVTTVMRQAQQFETARRELPKAKAVFMRSTDIAKTFCKGSQHELLDAMIDFCIERASGPATRLGRLRKRFESKRSPGSGGGVSNTTIIESESQPKSEEDDDDQEGPVVPLNTP
jgi:DNA-binding NarL/FixJ family response regulator